MCMTLEGLILANLHASYIAYLFINKINDDEMMMSDDHIRTLMVIGPKIC